MEIALSKINLKESPLLLLKNANETIIAPLCEVMNFQAQLYYNEVSQISFSLPRQHDGEAIEGYNALTGMQIVEWKDIGKFVLINPTIVDEGIREVKQCKGYSLEYEFTYKKISLENATYNFWNPVTPNSTILGIVMSYMPSWSVGTVDSGLIGKYRTFEVDHENLYDFMKNQLQESYSCIFEFDTLRRKVNVRDTNQSARKTPVFLSKQNLAKEIEIEEDTENICTVLDVNGADGVTIRSVNPMGINKIYNLDYFMNLTNFSQGMIDKWNAWKSTYDANQEVYYNITLNQIVQIARYETENAKLTDLKGELSNLEAQQAVVIQAIAQGLQTQSDLDAINAQIKKKQSEIKNQTNLLKTIQGSIDVTTSQQKEIIARTKFSAFFDENELLLLDRYFKEDAITDSSFVAATAKSYIDEDLCRTFSQISFQITNAEISEVAYSDTKRFYSVRGGQIMSIGGDYGLSATVVRGTLEYNSDKSVVCSFYLDDGSVLQNSFASGTLSLTGKSSGLTANSQTLQVVLTGCNVYFTKNVTDYEQRQIEWDLYEYGKTQLEKVSSPTYSFKITLENFFALDSYRAFCNQISLGEKVYIETTMGVLTPIVVGLNFDFDSIETISVEFGSTFDINNSTFDLTDLVQESVSMGKSVDFNKYNYNRFIDSGAESSVRDFMNSALDVARNAILSSSGQAISWDKSGLRLRKWENEAEGTYSPKQIWMANNSIMFTQDNWQNAVIGIGEFVDKNLGSCYGIVAPNLVGTLLAGENLVIESIKEDGGTAVFRVDGEGAFLHNADFNIVSGNTQITLNAEHAIGIGSYPLYKKDTDGNEVLDESKAKFWVDPNGNVHIKGTLEGCDGKFSGELSAASGTFSGAISGGSINIGNGNFVVTGAGNLTANSGIFRGTIQGGIYQDAGGNSMMNGNYEFTAGYLNLNGINVGNGNFVVDSSGNVTVRGSIQMGSGSRINWAQVSNTNLSSNPAYSLANSASSTANSAYNLADSAYDMADSADSTARELRSDVRDLVNGNYSGGSFIDEQMIYSATLVGGEIYWGRNGTYGSLSRTYGSDGVNRTDIVEMYSNGGIVLSANEGMRFEASSLWINIDADDVHVRYGGRYCSLTSLINQITG